jgi:hypothetical protein
LLAKQKLDLKRKDRFVEGVGEGRTVNRDTSDFSEEKMRIVLGMLEGCLIDSTVRIKQLLLAMYAVWNNIQVCR